MNLFDQITWKSSVQGFFWQKKSETPSFQLTQQPIAPITSSYVQPPITNTIFPQQSTQSFQQPVQQPVQEDSITTQLKAKGYNDKDIEFLKQAKQKGYTSQQAFWYLDSKKKPQQPVQETPITEKFKIKSSENFWLVEWAKDIWKFFANFPADTVENVWWFYDAIRHPINTLSSMYTVWQGISDKAVYSIANSISSAIWWKTVWPTEEAQIVDIIWKDIIDKYWTAWKFKKAVVENPVDTLLTLMGWLWVLGKVAEARNMVNVANNINKIQQVINPVNILKQEAKLVTKPIGYIGKEVIPQVLGKTTWTSPETIRTAFTQWGTPEFQSALRWETTAQDILNSTKEWLQAIKDNRSQLYWEDYKKLQENNNPIQLNEWENGLLWNTLKSLEKDYNVKPVYDAKWNLTWLDFSQSKITGGTSQSQVQSIVDDLKGWKDTTPTGMDILKQRIQDYFRGTPESSKGDRISTIVSNAIKDKIVAQVPEYADMTATYEKITNQIKEITKTLSLWDKTQAQTAITKLNWVLRENFPARQDMVKLIEQYSGKNIQWQIAWASLNPLLAKWLAWVITWGWFIFWQLANPAFWWWLALASPRLIGEIANTIWIPIEKFKSAINNLKNANITSNTTRSAMEWSAKVKPFTKTPIITQKITPKKITPTPEIKSSTQARWPIDPTTWKRKTIVQSPTAYEAWIRRPYTLSSLKAPQPKQLFAWENAKAPPKWKTGWFKWADGKMRFEIDDSQAKFEFPKRTTDKTNLEYWKASLDIADAPDTEVSFMKELDWFKWTNDEYRAYQRKMGYDKMYDIKKWEYRLWDVLQHSELYKQYPELANTPVSFHTEWGTRSAWEMTNWKISIAVNSKDPKSVILHEIQHIIQTKEWFAKGGSIDWVMWDIRNKITTLWKEMEKLWWKWYWTPEYNKIRSEYNSYIDIEKKAKTEPWKALELYKSLAWEVEARNVQSRMNLTAKERTIKKPESTEDIPRPKQIIRMGSKWTMLSRPYTLNGNKPIVKRASDVDSWLIEEKIPKPDEKFLAKFAEWKTLDEFMWFVRGSSTQYWGYEPRLRRYLRPESKRLNELVPKDPNTRMITIYRWIDKSENPRIKSEIKWWDFVTTSYDDALSYADSPANVVSKRVPISTLVTEFPEEFIKNNKWKSIGEIVDYELIWKPYDHPFIKVTDNQLKQIYEQAKSPQKTVKPLTEWKQSATMGDMETKKLIEEAKSLWKYDNSYDVLKGKKLYRWWNEDWVFWTDDIDIAKSFWDEWVIEKTITIKNPLDVRSKWIRDYIKKNTNINIDDATSAYSRSLPEFKKLMKWAKENWYDWIIGKTSDNWLNFTGNEFVILK